jgi:lysozyme
MLHLTTLVAVSLIGTAATPMNQLPTNRVSNPLGQEVAIREIAPVNLFETSPICIGCDLNKFEQAPSYEITPERRALLNTIRFAEGTWNEGQDTGYRVLFGGRMVSSLDKHPAIVQYSSRYASAAAGAYQFLPGTWQEASRKLNLGNFGPNNQDQAALYLVDKRKALQLADSGKMTPELASRLAPEWASFPTYKGRSYYDQPVRSFTELRDFYEANLTNLRRGSS